MRCSSCDFENPEGLKFCVKCATPLNPRCPQCGFENPSRSVFCGQCATPLTEQTPATKSTQIDRQTARQARRQGRKGHTDCV